MNSQLIKDVLKYSFIAISVKSILFVVGTFIENQTMPMAVITLAILLSLCSITFLMIRNFNGFSKLKLIEKLAATLTLFLIHELWGILLHTIYYLGILGQKPTNQEFFQKALEILKYDSFMLILMLIIALAVNSRPARDEKVQ